MLKRYTNQLLCLHDLGQLRLQKLSNTKALRGQGGVLGLEFLGFNRREHFKINSSIQFFLNHSRSMCRKFQGSNSKTLGEDRYLRVKNSVLR